MQGWIKLHRAIMQNPFWLEKPFSRGHAWADLLLMAAHEQTGVVFGGNMVALERGDVVVSELRLMDRWGWSKTKVRSFLSLLESEEMIAQKKDRKKTIVSISNYAVYQACADEEKTTEKPLKDHRKTTIQECKERVEIPTVSLPPPSLPKENPLKGVKERVSLPPTTDAQKIAQQLDDYTDNPVLRDDLNAFLEMRKKIRKPMTPYAVKLTLNKLSGFAKDDKTKSAILQQSIEASWQGIFPLKDQAQPKTWTPAVSPLEALASRDFTIEDEWHDE